MKRIVLAMALAGIVPVVGCSSSDSDSGMKMNNPFVKAKPSSKTPEYFEIPKDGKTYVFGSTKSMQAFFADSKVSTRMVSEVPGVMFEDSSYTDFNRLIETYKKNHGM